MFIGLLIIVEILLFITNYIPGTYLMGWDNVMPEFNILLNFKRSFFGLWQEYRGLGLLDGLSHTANLMHTFYIAALSVILPQSAVRYVFISLTHLAGGIGMYLLLSKLLKHKKAAIIGSLFYMLNLGVLQMYFAPLEVFAVHFAALPFLAITVINTLEAPTKKNYLLLFLATILTTPQGFVPTVFIAFLVFFFFQLIIHLVQTKKLKTVLLAGCIVASANAFWLIPYLYSGKYTTSVIPNTRINQFSSEEIFYRNKAYGDLINVVTMKGFMMGSVEFNTKTNTNDFFLQAWRNYTETPLYQLLNIVMILSAVIGIGAMLRLRNRSLYPFAAAGFVAFFFLANNTPFFQQGNDLFRKIFPVLGEAFRFPFTKFIILFAFSFSVFVGYGISVIWNKIVAFEKIATFVMILLVLILAFPAFRGNFFSPFLKVELPDDYSSMIGYLKTVDENQRIALLPAHTFWNWEYRSWGQRGSGFLWYGIAQPILKRPFDPWSFQNENFYNELSQSINSENTGEFKNVLTKYDVSYLLLDEYFVNNLSTKPINYDRLLRFLQNAGDVVKQEKTFGKLVLFKNKVDTSWIYSIKPSVSIPDQFYYSRDDKIYSNNGNYVTETDANTTYPFHSLYTEKQHDDNPYTITHNSKTITITRNKPFTIPSNSVLSIPNVLTAEALVPVKTEVRDNNLQLQISNPRFIINGKKIEIVEEPILIPLTSVKKPTSITFVDTQHTIKPGEISYIRSNFLNSIKVSDGKREELVTIDTKQIIRPSFGIPVPNKTISSFAIEVDVTNSPLVSEHVIQQKQYETVVPARDIIQAYQKDSAVSINKEKEVTFTIIGNSAELAMWRPAMIHEASYIVFAKTQHYDGLPITFYVDNPFEKRAELETRLPKTGGEQVVIIPSTQNYFEGYGLHFINKSIGKEKTKNTIQDVSVYPLPLDLIRSIRIASKDHPIVKNTDKNDLSFLKNSNISYSITNMDDSPYIVLSQAYHPDWTAYADGKKIDTHILVNNWANGWKIQDPGSKIQIVFWPQYLVWTGFAIMGFMGIFLLLLKSKPREV